MQIELLHTFHPLALFALSAVTSFVWGLQAAVGANVGVRRDLVWQTGFLLSLLLGGLLFVALYSIRPLTNTGPVKVPIWLERLGGRLPIILLGATVALSIVMELVSFLPPVYLLSVPWGLFSVLGALLSIGAIFSFVSMGGYMGTKWFGKVGQSTASHPLGFIPTWTPKV